MIYDFRFYNKNQDESFFLFLLASKAQVLNLEAFFYTYAEHTRKQSLRPTYFTICQ